MSMSFELYYMMSLVLGSMMIFMKFNKHVLLILMSLEFFVVSMFYIWFSYFNMLEMDQFMCLYYLVFAINESVLGLSIMILIVRNQGNDYFNLMTLAKW
uniref:NADH-ubiquinone oxidoreductase chain 4L n=1 Tax=Syrista parreyssii TaxID=1090889 RepID=A0A8K1TMU1_9HYME|nr:NADH dehydrogenase subunit 4L [Syrista parreyssii]